MWSKKNNFNLFNNITKYFVTILHFYIGKHI